MCREPWSAARRRSDLEFWIGRALATDAPYINCYGARGTRRSEDAYHSHMQCRVRLEGQHTQREGEIKVGGGKPRMWSPTPVVVLVVGRRGATHSCLTLARARCFHMNKARPGVRRQYSILLNRSEPLQEAIVSSVIVMIFHV